MIRIIAILSNDKTYARRLAEYMNASERMGLTAVPFSSMESYNKHSTDYKTEILMFEGDFIYSLSQNDEHQCRILMSDDEFDETKGYPCICKYKAVDDLMRDILRIYSSYEPEKLMCVAGVRSNIVGIYSPIGRIGKTTWSITYAMARAMKEKTLLITLEEYAGVYRDMCAEAVSDMSDVIYYFLQGNYSWSRLRSAVHTYGRLDYVPPVRYAEDLIQLSDEQLHELFIRIASEGGYEYIIIDFGLFGKKAASLLELCTHIYMPVIKDAASERKIEEFMAYLDISGRGHIKSKINRIKLILEPNRDYGFPELTDYMGGPLSQLAMDMISKEAKSDEG